MFSSSDVTIVPSTTIFDESCNIVLGLNKTTASESGGAAAFQGILASSSPTIS